MHVDAYQRLWRDNSPERIGALWREASRRDEAWRVLATVPDMSGAELWALLEHGDEKSLRWVYGAAKDRGMVFLCRNIMRRLGLDEDVQRELFMTALRAWVPESVRSARRASQRAQARRARRRVENANRALRQMEERYRIRRGDSFLEAGYVWAPYIPLQSSPTAHFDELSIRNAIRRAADDLIIQEVGEPPPVRLLNAVVLYQAVVEGSIPVYDHDPDGDPYMARINEDYVYAVAEGILHISKHRVFFDEGFPDAQMWWAVPGPHFPIPNLPWCLKCCDTKVCGNCLENGPRFRIAGVMQHFPARVEEQRTIVPFDTNIADSPDLDVFVNGLLMLRGEDYHVTGDTEITFTWEAGERDMLVVTGLEPECEVCRGTRVCQACAGEHDIVFYMRGFMPTPTDGQVQVDWTSHGRADWDAVDAPVPRSELQHIHIARTQHRDL